MKWSVLSTQLTEWIENPPDEDYDKQDCESKAFTRLAARLKQDFPPSSHSYTR